MNRNGRVSSNAFGPFAIIGGYEMPRCVTYSEKGPGTPGGDPDLLARFEIRDGVPECVALHLEVPPYGRAIRSADLRNLDLEGLAEQVFLTSAAKPLPGGGFALPAFGGDRREAERFRRALRANSRLLLSVSEHQLVSDLDAQDAARAALRSRIREKQPRSRTLLEGVARTYLEAWPIAPTEAVRRWLGTDVSLRTASRRVQAARDAMPSLIPASDADPADYEAAKRALADKPVQAAMSLPEAREWAKRRRADAGGTRKEKS